jgi:hypothetical protein
MWNVCTLREMKVGLVVGNDYIVVYDDIKNEIMHCEGALSMLSLTLLI